MLCRFIWLYWDRSLLCGLQRYILWFLRFDDNKLVVILFFFSSVSRKSDDVLAVWTWSRRCVEFASCDWWRFVWENEIFGLTSCSKNFVYMFSRLTYRISVTDRYMDRNTNVTIRQHTLRLNWKSLITIKDGSKLGYNTKQDNENN